MSQDAHFSGFHFLSQLLFTYARKEINTPAATAEPITPEMLLAIQYCNT